ncbi:MAG TPA: RluA family pseudouridine synthase [Polyangiaceae bacterium]|nr:RluA family pseudouridine synthase [Polyangiaceae bacterium]
MELTAGARGVSGAEQRFIFKDLSFVAPEGRGAQPLDRLLREKHDGASWAEVRRLIETGKVSVNGSVQRETAARVPSGAQIELRMAAARLREGPRLPPGAIVHLDPHVVVVQKPAGISTVPYDENETGTLDELVRAELGRKEAPLGIVHRIDKETSGLVLFARNLSAKLDLKNQFRVHSVRRRYRAIVHGSVRDRTIASRLVQDRGDGRRGSTNNPKLGRESVTHVFFREALTGATLIECRLETGRTHQIRIHLSEAGHPLVGERVYAKNNPHPTIAAPRLMLHALQLGFRHPTTNVELDFEQPLPEDFLAVLERLRG